MGKEQKEDLSVSAALTLAKRARKKVRTLPRQASGPSNGAAHLDFSAAISKKKQTQKNYLYGVLTMISEGRWGGVSACRVYVRRISAQYGPDASAPARAHMQTTAVAAAAARWAIAACARTRTRTHTQTQIRVSRSGEGAAMRQQATPSPAKGLRDDVTTSESCTFLYKNPEKKLILARFKRIIRWFRLLAYSPTNYVSKTLFQSSKHCLSTSKCGINFIILSVKFHSRYINPKI